MLDGRSYEQGVYDKWTLLLDGTLLHNRLPVVVTVDRDKNQHVIYGYRLWNDEGKAPSRNYLSNVCADAETHASRRIGEFAKVGLHDDITAAIQFHVDMIERERVAQEETARDQRNRMLLERADWHNSEYVDLMIRHMMARLDQAITDAADRISNFM